MSYLLCHWFTTIWVQTIEKNCIVISLHLYMSHTGFENSPSAEKSISSVVANCREVGEELKV